MLKVGIVGLPNVGKSTLFNALLKKQVADVANYPFCTIEPNIGVIEVPDDRLAILAKIVNTEKIIPAAVEFYDIAGLVKGASVGEGLGNQFLSHIREVDLIVHVVRLFEDKNITHVDDRLDPQADISTINSELILADLQTLSNQKEPKGVVTKEEKLTYQTIQKLKTIMDKGIAARDANLSENEIMLLKKFNLLTFKKMLYVFNVSEQQLEHCGQTKTLINKLGDVSGFRSQVSGLYLSAGLESEIAALSTEDQKEYLKQYNLEESGLNKLIKTAYQELGLMSYLTGGVKEARAWTVKNGTLAPAAAGVIHTDFEKHFIKAEVADFDTFVKYNGWQGCREAGKITLAGKNYIVRDGDVIDFKVGA